MNKITFKELTEKINTIKKKYGTKFVVMGNGDGTFTIFLDNVNVVPIFTASSKRDAYAMLAFWEKAKEVIEKGGKNNGKANGKARS